MYFLNSSKIIKADFDSIMLRKTKIGLMPLGFYIPEETGKIYYEKMI
jgi:hypothetical protein